MGRDRYCFELFFFLSHARNVSMGVWPPNCTTHRDAFFGSSGGESRQHWRDERASWPMILVWFNDGPPRPRRDRRLISIKEWRHEKIIGMLTVFYGLLCKVSYLASYMFYKCIYDIRTAGLGSLGYNDEVVSFFI